MECMGANNLGNIFARIFQAFRLSRLENASKELLWSLMLCQAVRESEPMGRDRTAML